MLDYKAYLERYIALRRVLIPDYTSDIDEVMIAVYNWNIYTCHNDVKDDNIIYDYLDIIKSSECSIYNHVIFFHISITKTGTYLLCYVIDESCSVVCDFGYEYEILVSICSKITSNFIIKKDTDNTTSISSDHPELPFVDLRK